MGRQSLIHFYKNTRVSKKSQNLSKYWALRKLKELNTLMADYMCLIDVGSNRILMFSIDYSCVWYLILMLYIKNFKSQNGLTKWKVHQYKFFLFCLILTQYTCLYQYHPRPVVFWLISWPYNWKSVKGQSKIVCFSWSNKKKNERNAKERKRRRGKLELEER